MHVPVLVEEVLEWLGCAPGGTYVDCTVGLGGHAMAILERTAPSGRLIAIDADGEALEEARRRLRAWKERVTFVRENFRNLGQVLKEHGEERVDGVLFDLGMSSAQLENAGRGFSLYKAGALDMRFDQRQSLTAAEVVNNYSEREMLRILREYGEERAARRVVGAIVRRRERSKISSTDELADVVAGAVGRRRGIHPATKTFQAIRIEVNGELESLELAVPQAIGGLRSGGRLAIISYHSGEERVVKRTFGEFEKGCVCPAWFPVCKCGRVSEIEVLTKKAIRPSEEEVKRNPRSRSGRMRVCARKGTERGT